MMDIILTYIYTCVNKQLRNVLNESIFFLKTKRKILQIRSFYDRECAIKFVKNRSFWSIHFLFIFFVKLLLPSPFHSPLSLYVCVSFSPFFSFLFLFPPVSFFLFLLLLLYSLDIYFNISLSTTVKTEKFTRLLAHNISSSWSFI